jgi:hypothetical protein
MLQIEILLHKFACHPCTGSTVNLHTVPILSCVAKARMRCLYIILYLLLPLSSCLFSNYESLLLLFAFWIVGSMDVFSESLGYLKLCSYFCGSLSKLIISGSCIWSPCKGVLSQVFNAWIYMCLRLHWKQVLIIIMDK